MKNALKNRGKLLLAFLILMLAGKEIKAQNTSLLERKISISFEHKSIKDVLEGLGKKAACLFSYSPTAVDSEILFTGNFRDVSLREILDELFKEYQTTYINRGSTVLIKTTGKKKPTNPKKDETRTKNTGNILGNVSDTSGQYISYATVNLKGTTKGVITDESGNFYLKGLPSGLQTLVVSSAGFDPKEAKVDIKAGQNTSVKVVLFQSLSTLNEVIVKGKSVEVEKLEQSAVAVTVIETQKAQLQTADLGDVLARVQGVNVQRSGGLGSNTRFSLNGLTDDQIRFFLDGIPLDFMGYSMGIANVPVNLIERAEIYKGVVPIRFGADALGGAVNLVSLSDFTGTGGDLSYQAGSFGTHRTTLSVRHQPENKSFFVSSNAFFDRARNNYEVEVEVPDERGRLSEVTVPRFHDAYLAFGTRLEAGWHGIPWADKLSLSGFYNQSSQEFQHNNVMTVPFGEVVSTNANYGGLIRWQKNAINKLNIDLSLGYSRNEVGFEDISIFFYDWFGNTLKDDEGNPIKRNTQGELGLGPVDRVVWDDNYFSRLVFDHQIKPNFNLHFSSSFSYIKRNGNDRLNTTGRDPLTVDQNAFTWVNGIELEWEKDKLENRFFVKNYYQNVNAEELIPGNRIRNQDRKSHNAGLGNNFRVNINDQLSVKATYEWTARMPLTQEIFGNGAQIFANLELQPERSHNANLEFIFQKTGSKGASTTVNLNGFFRGADRLITLLGDGQLFSFQNVFGATSLGTEIAVEWSSANTRFQFNLNGTWQEFRNTSTGGAFSDFKGDRIPNRPYLFANWSFRYLFPEVFLQNDEVSIYANSRYVHQFFRTWESVGLSQFKEEIPSQLAHTIGSTYKFFLGKTVNSLTFEAQNVSNARIFDFFGVQRPGRNYSVKITTQF